MPVSESYRDQVAELLDFAPELTIKRMFGGAGVWSAGLFFALIIDDELYFKTDDQTRPLFEAQGCAPWTYALKGGAPRDMGYLRAPDGIWDEPEEARRWVGLALDAALRKHRPKRAGRT